MLLLFLCFHYSMGCLYYSTYHHIVQSPVFPMRLSIPSAQGMWTDHFCFAQLVPVTRIQQNLNKCFMNKRRGADFHVNSPRTRVQTSKRRVQDSKLGRKILRKSDPREGDRIGGRFAQHQERRSNEI